MNDKTLSIVVKADDQASGVMQKINGSVEQSASAMDKAKGVAADFSGGLMKASIATGVAATALTVYAKGANNFLVSMVGEAKSLARETGSTEIEASKLLAVTKRLGIGAGEASSMFGIFSKQIADSGEKTKESAAKQSELQNKISASSIQIEKLNTQMRKNGDANGELKNKIEGLGISINNYKKELSDVSNPLASMNIATKNADGSTKAFNAVLSETADKFKTMPAGAEKTALAMELFGRSGKEMLKFLNLGSQGIKQLEDSATRLGLTLTSKNIGAVNAYVTSQKQLKDTTDALKMSVGALTAPVLTQFNNTVNSSAQALINSSGPAKMMLANVLAFGGPVLAASSAFFGLAANTTTAITGLQTLGRTMAVTSSFMLGPWGLAIAATVAAVAGLSFIYMSQRNSVDELKAAHDRVKLSQDAVKTSQEQLALAQVGATAATLAIEQAQKNYNDAVTNYGPASLQARQANNDLERAILAKRDAERQAQSALSDMQKAEQQYAKDKQFEASIAAKRDAVDGLQGAFNAFRKSVAEQMPQSQKSGPNVPKGIGLEQSLRNAFSFRASGGPVSAGRPYIVGENEPELFVPNQSGQILNGKQMAQAGVGGGGTNITINGNVINETPEASNAFWNRVDQTQRMARIGMA